MSCHRFAAPGVRRLAGHPWASPHRPLAMSTTLVAALVILTAGPARPQAPADSAASSFADTTATPRASVATSFADTTRPVLFIQEIVVTGARYPRAYYESPQALSFVSRAQLRDQGPTVLGDVLSTLPGVDMNKDSPWEQRPTLRGLGGQRVLVMMDGIPINSARGNGPHPSLVDPAQVERIEVVRGPSSVAYGSDALGGAINIITRDPVATDDRRLRGAATLGGSSADRQRNAFVELQPHLGKLAAFLSGGGRHAFDYRLPDDPSNPLTRRMPRSGFKDYDALANLRYELSPLMTLRGSYQLYRGNDIGLPGLAATLVDPTSELVWFRQEFRFPDYDRDAASLMLERETPDSWVARTRARMFWQREHRNFFSHEEIATDSLGPHPPSERTRVTDQDRFFDLDTYGFQAQLTSRKSDRYVLSSGLDLARDKTDGDNGRRRHWVDAYGTTVRTDVDYVTASVPDGTFDSYAGFAQGEWSLAPRWTASAGARYTRYRYRTAYGLRAESTATRPAAYFQPRSVNDGSLSGSLGIVFAPLANLHLTANVANGYRQPNAQDLFYNGPASVGTVLGNQDLKPEKSVSYDLGVRWGPGDLGVAANLFYSTYDDLIDAIQVAAPPAPGAPATYQYVNVTQARIWGGDLQAECRFLKQYQVRTALAWQIGDITNPDAILQLYGVVQDRAPLPSIPPVKGSAALRWRNASGRFWVEPSARWSWRTNRLPLPTPGVPFYTEFKKEWLVGDLMAGARLPAGQRAVVGVRNIADRSYRQAIGSIEEPGRSWVGSLTIDF
jgi:hemoglobin/transferrin/lactoferrin receptor protein